MILDFFKIQAITNKTINIVEIKCIIIAQRIRIVESLEIEKKKTYGKVVKVKLNNIYYAIKEIPIISIPKNYQDKNSEINIIKKAKLLCC